MDWLFGESKMAKVIRNKDWSKSSLGPINTWPQSLKTTVSLCLNSNFPISLAWGPNHIQIYNDGYWPICGNKHPDSMGQNFKECWAAPWPMISEAFEQALAGKASYITNQRMFLERFGYIEETFFTFSFSPIRGETGKVEGLFHPVTEVTEKMLNERRSRILRDIPAQTSKARTIEEAVQLTIQCLSNYNLDLPFALFYFYDEANNNAHLMGNTGLPRGHPSCPDTISMKNPSSNQWPIHKLKNTNLLEMSDLEKQVGLLVTEPYPEPIKKALLSPIFLSGQKLPYGAFIFGVSTRRALDESYLTFYEMLGTVIATSFNTANAYEEERKKAEALAEIDRAKTAFFHNISHEFRTPLTLMLSPLESILFENKFKLPQKIKSDLEVVYRNSIRLLKLVNNLLDFSRLESQQMEALFEPVCLDEITLAFASSFLYSMEKAGLKFHLNCNPLKEPIYVDQAMWEKIVLNLLSNAFKYTLQGSITLTLAKVDQHVELTVKDTGVGISDEEIPQIFNRFHRVKGSKGRTHEGSGIGLALVAELVKFQGGSLRVESKVDVGSVFTISLPLGSAHLPADQIKPKITTEATSTNHYTNAFVQEALGLLYDDTVTQTENQKSANSRLSAKIKLPERIIFADDNPDMRKYLSGILSEYYDVLTVANGEEALHAILAQPPDVIISDIMMPVMDGIELIKQVRANQSIAEIPIILLSARAGQEAMITGIESGADDYLVKPFSAKELLARIKQQISMLHLRRASNKLKSEFLAHVSHELRTPLTTIIGFISLIFEGKVGAVSPAQKGALQHVINASHHLLELINVLLDAAKIEAGTIEFHPEPIDLQSTVTEVINTLDILARKKNIKIRLKMDCPFSTVNLDPLRFQQILYNLLSNAIKFTPVNGQVIIRLSPYKHTMFRIDVEDNGIGIKKENILLLFCKFKQLDIEMTQKGTGLGLFITKILVEAQGGKIDVKSVVNKGTTFSAILPINMAIGSEPQKASQTWPSGNKNSLSPKILNIKKGQ